jgi:hypothetical protein
LKKDDETKLLLIAERSEISMMDLSWKTVNVIVPIPVPAQHRGTVPVQSCTTVPVYPELRIWNGTGTIYYEPEEKKFGAESC